MFGSGWGGLRVFVYREPIYYREGSWFERGIRFIEEICDKEG